MTAPLLDQPCVFEGFGYPVADIGGVKPGAIAAEKESFFFFVDTKDRTGSIQVLLEPVECCFTNGDKTGFASLTFVNEESLTVDIEIFDSEIDKFGSACSGGVKGFQYGTVTDT